jgi:hypothetical protein
LDIPRGIRSFFCDSKGRKGNKQIKMNGREKQAEAVVGWQAWRKPDPYQLILWKWIDQ